MRFVLNSKIHKLKVTDVNPESNSNSITIDKDLIDKADLWPGEKVLVVSNTTGKRLETYVSDGERKSGIICMNGACAHVIGKGEEITIMGFKLTEKQIYPIKISVDDDNKIAKIS